MAYRKRIGIVHPNLSTVGGSELRPAWIAQALKDDFEIALISLGSVSLDFINGYAGTQLEEEKVRVLGIKIPAIFKNRGAALRNYRLARYCFAHSKDFDLMISTYNVMSFGNKGIQFIADLSFNDDLRRHFHRPDQFRNDIIYGASLPRKAYIKLSFRLNRLSDKSWLSNTTIANSVWTKNVLKDFLRMNAKVIYPPVPDVSTGGSWEDRENGFVYLGRISSEKRILEIIKIIHKVREQDKTLHLHLVGPSNDPRYARVIKDIIEVNRDWLSWEGILLGSKKHELLNRHRYGITGCLAESFGIAAAEQAKSGCLVWVPNSGGQVEIVEHPMLVYNNSKDAIEKISAVLNSNSIIKELQKHLVARSKRFSPGIFMSQVRELIDDHFKADFNEND